MKDAQVPSAFIRFGGFLLFLVLLLGAFIWFGWGIFQLALQIGSHSQVITLDKDALYMLGVGIGLFALTYAALHEVILKLPLTEKVARRITLSGLVGIGLMFILPHAVHYPVEHYLESEGYEICSKVSDQWLLYRKIVYVASPEVCAEMVKNKKKKKK